MVEGEKVVRSQLTGDSHNFVSKELVVKLSLPVEWTFPYVVELRDGEKVECQGLCTSFSVRLPWLQMQQGYYLFELRGADSIKPRYFKNGKVPVPNTYPIPICV